MAKASELLSKLARTSRRNDLVSAIAQDILKRTKCDPNLLNVEFEDEDNDNPAIATFTYTFANGRVVPIIWEENQDPNKTIDDDFRTLMYQQFIADIINDVCDREDAKKSAQEELDRRAAAILQPNKANPILTQSQIEAIERAGGFPISGDEEVLLVTGKWGGRISAIKDKHSRWHTKHYNSYNAEIASSEMPLPIETLAIPDEKIIAVFPTHDYAGPLYITAPRGDEFWYQGRTTLVHGDKRVTNLWFNRCAGTGSCHDHCHDYITYRSAICLAIEAASDGNKNCSGYA